MKIPINKHEEIQNKKNLAELYESNASLILKGFSPEEAQVYLDNLHKKYVGLKKK